MRGNARGLLVPGRNCWRMAHAARVGFLVDGSEYFSAVRAALAGAQRDIFILGWDIDSRMWLVPGGANDGFPEPLREFLDALLARTTAAADLRAELGLRVAVCARARVAWTAEVRLADAKQTAFRARQPSSDRRVAPSEAGRRRRCAGVRQRLRPHLQPLGHAAPFASGSGAAQSRRHPLSAFSRCRRAGRRRGRARIGRAGPRALASCDRTHGAAARSEDGARLVAGRCADCHQRCRTSRSCAPSPRSTARRRSPKRGNCIWMRSPPPRSRFSRKTSISLLA